jgi:hypothetical protein
VIALRSSQRLEDRAKGKVNQRVRFETGENLKTGFPARDKTQNIPNIVATDKDNVDIPMKRTETHHAGKGLPYVDVPPIKATSRVPISDPIRSDQHLPKSGPTYKSRAPVEIGLDIEKLVETVLDLEISVPLRSLAGVSGAIQKEIRKQVTKSRLPLEVVQNVVIAEEKDEESPLRIDSLPSAAYIAMEEVSDEIPEGHLTAGDPVLQYLLEHGEVPSGSLAVARRSEDLRAIYMTINRVGQEECLLDNGSMIVSMSKELAVQLGLNWDPAIRIDMESASSHVERTLGLAKNVRFAVGGLDLFLQIHILEKPPYGILLGRPFYTLTSCVTKDSSDGSSEVTLTDPNTKEVAVVPTYKRGERPEDLHKQKYQGF